MRINKYLSRTGYCSRRKADELISAGKITINGKKAVLGQNVSDSDEISAGSKTLNYKEVSVVVYAVNKPRGVVSTAIDEQNRQTVVGLVGVNQRLYPVGRLDKNSTGLILLTNNGDLAHKLTHPKFEVEKEYEVKLNSVIDEDAIAKLTRGIKFRGINYQADSIIQTGHNRYNIILHEGKNREIRKMMQAVGAEVLELKRVRIGNLELGDLKEGENRKLTAEEITKLTS